MLRKLIALVYLVITAFLLSCNNPSAAVEDVDYLDELHEIAQKVNQKCPQLLDSETRLDGIDILQTNTIVYKHTLIHVNAANVDTVAFKKELWPGLLGNIKVSRDMKKLREHQTTASYYYADKNNVPICTIKIQAKDYN